MKAEKSVSTLAHRIRYAALVALFPVLVAAGYLLVPMIGWLWGLTAVLAIGVVLYLLYHYVIYYLYFKAVHRLVEDK